MKKTLIIMTIVIEGLAFLFFGLLTFNYAYNEHIISKYEDKNYSQDLDILTHTNIIEPYVVYYNNGNIHYQSGEYEAAIDDYKEALERKPDHGGIECDIRVNLALAVIEKLPDDYSEPENIDQSIETLQEAKGYLLKEDCAKDDGHGHDKDAQKLKEEIDELIKQLEERKEQQSQEPQDDDDQNQQQQQEQQNQNNNQYSEENSIREELQQIQQDAHEEREETLDLYEELEMDTDFSNWGETIW